MNKLTLALAGLMAGGMVMAAVPDDYVASVEQWRKEREERLRQPQGWLSLVGLHWIQPGTHAVGRDPGNGIVLATGPDRLGSVTLDDNGLRFTPAEGVEVSIDGTRVDAEVTLLPDTSGRGSVLVIGDGQATVQPIERGGRLALRVRDANAETRTGFRGIESYAIDPSWRTEARFEPHPEGATLPIANVIGQLEPMANPGAVVFERDGRQWRLEAVDEGDGSLFLIFADRTSGRETYGAGRFLYAPRPVDGLTVVDFNKAYNPPCAFNEYSTCPLPPPENRLDLAVTAGEKKYEGPGHEAAGR